MNNSSRWTAAAGLVAALSVSACGPATSRTAPRGSQPAPAAEISPPPAASSGAAGTGEARRNEADVRFMQGMIGHHAQALEMTALVPTRTARADVRLMAERIEVSQHDEIAAISQWLRAHGAAVPALDAHHAHGAAGGGHAMMPGMLTREEMARLTAASGAEFDRLFLELMIRHHEGALAMVAELFARQGAGQDVDLFRIASDIDSDQRAEIERMRRMLSGPLSGTSQR